MGFCALFLRGEWSGQSVTSELPRPRPAPLPAPQPISEPRKEGGEGLLAAQGTALGPEEGVRACTCGGVGALRAGQGWAPGMRPCSCVRPGLLPGLTALRLAGVGAFSGQSRAPQDRAPEFPEAATAAVSELTAGGRPGRPLVCRTGRPFPGRAGGPAAPHSGLWETGLRLGPGVAEGWGPPNIVDASCLSGVR